MVFSLYVLLHCRSSIGFAPWPFYSEVAVISSEENGKQLQRKPYTNSELPVLVYYFGYSKWDIQLEVERLRKAHLSLETSDSFSPSASI
jgi:hypothetical protein